MVAAPGLVMEMSRAKALTWARLGCCPDPNHKYGFHLEPGKLPKGDYSLIGAKNKPVGQHCCATDIGTTSKDARRYVASMFARWDAQQQPPDMAEFIGSPDGRKVLYASFRNPGRVELYRGTGHDVWMHCGKFRSLATRDGHWLDPAGPYLGPVLGNTGEDTLMAVTEADFDKLAANVTRLNKQMDRVDDIIGGKGEAYKDSNLATQLGYIVTQVRELSGRVDELGKRLGTGGGGG